MHIRKSYSPCAKIILCSLKKHSMHIVLLSLLCFGGVLLPSVTPLVYRQIVDTLIPGRNIRGLLLYVILLILIPMITSLLLNWRNITAYKLSNQISCALRLSLFQKIAEMDYAAYLRMGAKSLVYRLTRSCGQIVDVFLNNTVLSLINSSFALAMSLLPMLFLEYRLALAAMIALPILYLLLDWVKKRVSIRDRRLYQVLMTGESLMHETLEGLRAIRLSGSKERHTQKIRSWLETHNMAKLSSVKAHEFERASLPELCLQILYGLVFIFGAVLVMEDEMSIGTLVAFVAYVPRAFGSLRELLMIQVTFKSVAAVLESVNEVFEIPSEPSGVKLLSEASGRISFDNVCFQYDAASGFALKDISFEVSPGEAVAVIGETGGGKSTIFDLLLRFYQPASGTIRVDGVDISEYNMDSYRSNFSVVSQMPFLCRDTFQNNVIDSDKEIDVERYRDALEKAQLADLLDRLPNQDQTLLGEGGQDVSGGERQRIALAHAIYQNRPIILLDEPTAALDVETEARIRDVLLSYKGKKTLLVITHRLSTVLQYDRVLIIKNGRIIENGSPKELMHRESVLRHLLDF